MNSLLFIFLLYIDSALGSLGLLLIAGIVIMCFSLAVYVANREPTNKKVKQNRSWLINYIGDERLLANNPSTNTNTKTPSVVKTNNNTTTKPHQTNNLVSNNNINTTVKQKPTFVPKPIPKPAPQKPVVKEKPINIELFKNTNIDYKKYKNDKSFFDAVISAYKNPLQNHKRVYKTPKDLLNFICYYCNINLEDILFKKDNKKLDTKPLFANILNELSKHLYINYKNLSLNNRVLMLSDFGQIKHFDNYNNVYDCVKCILGFYDNTKITFDEIIKQFDEFVDEVWEKSKSKDEFLNKLQYQ